MPPYTGRLCAGELTAKDYFVKGNTALYDAVGKVVSVVTDSAARYEPGV